MSDTSEQPVSIRKTPASAKPGMARPTVIVALAAAMLLSGLAAVVAALTLYGQHGYLVRTLEKSQPAHKITSTEIADVSDAAGRSLTTGLSPLVGQTLTSKQISTQADQTGAAVKAAIPTENATDDEINSQVDKTTSAVKSALKKVSGALTAAQVSSQSNDVKSTVDANLTDLQKSQLSPQQIQDKANKAPTQILIQNLLLLLALGLVGAGAYVGRHWSRWAVPVIWVLASFTGTAAGFTSVLQLGADLPAAYKIGGAVSALSLIAAVVLGLLRPSKAWYDAHRPAVVDGAQRRGLFGPRVPPPSTRSRPQRGVGGRPGGRFALRAPVAGGTPAGTTGPAKTNGASAARTSGPKSKQRAAAQSASKGAAAARARAKTASKSRRTSEN